MCHYYKTYHFAQTRVEKVNCALYKEEPDRLDFIINGKSCPLPDCHTEEFEIFSELCGTIYEAPFEGQKLDIGMIGSVIVTSAEQNCDESGCQPEVELSIFPIWYDPESSEEPLCRFYQEQIDAQTGTIDPPEPTGDRLDVMHAMPDCAGDPEFCGQGYFDVLSEYCGTIFDASYDYFGYDDSEIYDGKLTLWNRNLDGSEVTIEAI